jgi:hypothetical protein
VFRRADLDEFRYLALDRDYLLANISDGFGLGGHRHFSCATSRLPELWVFILSEVGALFADASADATTERSTVDRQVGTDGRGINEAYRLAVSAFDDGEPRKRALVVFVLVLIEPEPAAEADRRWKFWC